jgi:prefoldin subunit 5
MVALFRKKPKIPASERVKELSAQGFAEIDIIKQMKKEGYSVKDVDAAMKEVLKTAVAKLPTREEFLRPPTPMEKPVERPVERPRILEEIERPRPELALPGEEIWTKPIERPLEIRPKPERPEIEEEFKLPAVRPKPAIEKRAEIEEIAEAIIAEKWENFSKEIEAVNKKIADLDAKISAIDISLQEVRGIKRSDIEEIKGSIENYKGSLTEVSSRMESIERAVRDSLGPMLQTLRAMSDTIKALKVKKE